MHSAHAVGFHRGDWLTEQDEVEAGKGLDWWRDSRALLAYP